MNFTKLKAMIGDMAAQIQDKKDQREKLLQRREELDSLPITREDFLNWTDDVLDGMQNNYADRLKNQLQGTIWNHSPLRMPAGGFPLFKPWSSGDNNTAAPYALVALMGPMIREQLKRIVSEMEWPENVGPSIAARRTEIEKIDGQLEKIESELAGLTAAAKEAGLSL